MGSKRRPAEGFLKGGKLSFSSLTAGSPQTINGRGQRGSYQCSVRIIISIIMRVFCPRACPSLQAQEPRLQFCRRQDFHRKVNNQDWSFTKDWLCAVVSLCFPHPTLALATEETLKDLIRSQGHHLEVRRVDLANWALQTSPKFTTGIK